MTVMSQRTGRTQRMLDASVEQARQGEYVVVIANDAKHVGLLYDRLMGFGGAEPTNRENGKVYFPGGGSVSVLSRHEDQVDIRHGRLLGAHPSVIVHADHFAVTEWIEEQIGGWARSQLAAWDETTHAEGGTDG